MIKIFRNFLIFTLIIASCGAMWGATPASKPKIEVTPVDIDDDAPEAPRLHYYDSHGEPLDEPVYFLAELDTITKPSSRPVYPLLHSLDIGINFADAIMMLINQKHASFDLHADLNLYNWIIPYIDLGIGFADSKPEGGNFRYKGFPSFYGKVGLNYNFLYKSDPAYRAFIGLNAGFSTFRYDITDISVNSDYWQETSHTSILNQRATAFYGEALAGLKVKIGGPISMGWTFGYHFKFHTSQPTQSNPWFIPGYGTNSPIHITFSLIYTIPLSKTPLTPENATINK